MKMNNLLLLKKCVKALVVTGVIATSLSICAFAGDYKTLEKGYYVMSSCTVNGETTPMNWDCSGEPEENACMPCLKIDGIKDGKVYGELKISDINKNIAIDGVQPKDGCIELSAVNNALTDEADKEETGVDTEYTIKLNLDELSMDLGIKDSQFDTKSSYTLAKADDKVLAFYNIKEKVDGSDSTETTTKSGNDTTTVTTTESTTETTTESVTLNQDGKIKVILNEKPLAMSNEPVIKNGTTLVPMRSIFEALGAKIDWNGTVKEVTAVKGDTTVKIKIGNKTATVNAKNVDLAVPAEINNGVTMVPLRFVSESLGANVDWNGTTKTITITDKE